MDREDIIMGQCNHCDKSKLKRENLPEPPLGTVQNQLTPEDGRDGQSRVVISALLDGEGQIHIVNRHSIILILIFLMGVNSMHIELI